MAEYIEREAAMAVVRHAWAKGLEPSQYIEELSAADVVEVVHGRWVEHDLAIECQDGREFECSVCHEFHYLPTKCCPNCGARMDGE